MLICPASSRRTKPPSEPAPVDENHEMSSHFVEDLLEACKVSACNTLSAYEKMAAMEALRRMSVLTGTAKLGHQLARYQDISDRSRKKLLEEYGRDVDVIDSKLRRNPPTITKEDYCERMKAIKARLASSLEDLADQDAEASHDIQKRRACLILAVTLHRMIAIAKEYPFHLLRERSVKPTAFVLSHPLACALERCTSDMRARMRKIKDEKRRRYLARERVDACREAGCRLLQRSLRGIQIKQVHSLLTTLGVLI